MQKSTIVYIKLIVTMAIWGGTFVVGKIITSNLDPFAAGLGRFASASIFLWLLNSYRKEKLVRLNFKQILLVILLGLSGILAYNLCFFLGLREITASRAGLIIALNPICITIASRIFFQEKLTWLKLIGILVSLLGAVLIITEGNVKNIIQVGISQGELLILGCVVSWVVYSLIGKLAMRELPTLTVTTYSIWSGTVFLIPFTIWENDHLPQINFLVILGLLYLGILATVVAFNWYYAGIREIGASKAAIFINLVPMFATIFGTVFLQESLTAIALTGGILVILGVSLVNTEVILRSPL